LSDDEGFFPDWPRRRWRGQFSNWFEDFERSFEEIFKGMELPKELIRERNLPDGATVREMGPFVYGYSISVGPDGKPVVREFGNVKPSISGDASGAPRPRLSVKDEREPLVDAIVNDENVKVVAELPGVEKSDIAVECDGRSLTLKVDTEKRRYYKRLELPAEVDPDTSKASYKNGVLELVLTKMAKGSKPKQIRVD